MTESEKERSCSFLMRFCRMDRKAVHENFYNGANKRCRRKKNEEVVNCFAGNGLCHESAAVAQYRWRVWLTKAGILYDYRWYDERHLSVPEQMEYQNTCTMIFERWTDSLSIFFCILELCKRDKNFFVIL